MGRILNITLSPLHAACLNAALQSLHIDRAADDQEVQKFFRVVVNKNIYFSKEYSRVKARNSFTVEYICPLQGTRNIGSILYFVKHLHVTFAVVNELVPLSNVSAYFSLPTNCLNVLHCSGVKPVAVGATITYVPVQNILKKAIFINFNVQCYVATFPSSIVND